MQEWEEFHEEKTVAKVYDAALLRRLMGYVRPYRGAAVAAVGLIVLSSLLQLVGPLATALALDLYVGRGLRLPPGGGGRAGGGRPPPPPRPPA